MTPNRPFAKKTVYRRKNNTNIFGELLDTRSKPALIPKHVKHHHGPEPVHSEFTEFTDSPSSYFPNH